MTASPAEPPFSDSDIEQKSSEQQVLNHSALRYAREEALHTQLSTASFTQSESRSHSPIGGYLEVGQLGSLPSIIDTIRENLGTDRAIRLYLAPAAQASARALPSHKSDIAILVSQHFFDDLSDTERAFIIGRECGRVLNAHYLVPAEDLLSGARNRLDPQTYLDVWRWALCSEVSSDLYGFIASGGDTKSAQTGLVRTNTGVLDEARIASLLDFLGSADSGASQPLLGLRIDLLQKYASLDMLNSYGEPVSQEELERHQAEISDTIDAAIDARYGMCFEQPSTEQGTVLFYLGTAAAIARGKLDEAQVVALNECLCPHMDGSSFFQALQKAGASRKVSSMAGELIDRAIKEAQEKSYTSQQAMNALQLVLISASANAFPDTEEFDVLQPFAEAFDLAVTSLSLQV